MKNFLSQTQAEQLQTLCERWMREYPAWSGRLFKAQQLVEEGKVVLIGLFLWRVKGSSGWHQVQWTHSGSQCDCVWWSLRKERCSHLLACGFWFRLFGRSIISSLQALSSRPLSLPTVSR